MQARRPSVTRKIPVGKVPAAYPRLRAGSTAVKLLEQYGVGTLIAGDFGCLTLFLPLVDPTDSSR